VLEDSLLDGFGQVFPQVEAIGDVDGIRGAEPCGFGVGGGAVAADDLHSGVGSQPGPDSFHGAVGQQVDGTAGLDVDQDGRVDVALTQSELVDPQYTRRWRLGLGDRAYQPEQGGTAGRDGEGFRQAGAGPASQHQPEPLQHGLELLTSPSVPEGDTLDLLNERRPRATLLAAPEPADP
jgi:hypothetical protein